MDNVLKSFKTYVQDNEREYHLRIKTVAPIDDKEMEYIEHILAKYVPKDITAPIKTIMQKHPLDFRDIRNAEVWIVDVVTSLPVSAYVLQQELKLALMIPEKYIIVRSANDPVEIESQRIVSDNEIDMQAIEQGLSQASRLSTNSIYDEDEQGELEDPVYGDEYNKKFLSIVADVAAERELMTIEPHDSALNANPGMDVEESPPVNPTNDFNDGIYDQLEDTPKPVYPNYSDTLKNLRKEGRLNPSRLSVHSNYDDDEITRSKKYDEYGDSTKVAVVTIKNTKEGIRKSK